MDYELIECRTGVYDACVQREAIHTMAWNESERYLLLEDYKVYREIERWGTALFLAGIGLIGKELAALQARGMILVPWSDFGPLAAGFLGAVFLLVVNHRGRRTRAKLDNNPVRRRGTLGWLFAGMPFLFGATLTGIMRFSTLSAVGN